MIKNELKDKELYRQLSPLLSDLELSIIEISEFEKDGRTTIRMVIQSRTHNTTIADCTGAHKLIFPRLEMLRASRDVYLEVSTPGIQRNIKDRTEFSSYIGKDVRILTGDDWVSGRLVSSDDDKIGLDNAGDVTEIAYSQMKKAKLVYNWEDKK